MNRFNVGDIVGVSKSYIQEDNDDLRYGIEATVISIDDRHLGILSGESMPINVIWKGSNPRYDFVFKSSDLILIKKHLT